jgi:hypothetical protein
VSSPARTTQPGSGADPAEWEQTGVRLEIADATATVTLCRPERRNAQSPALWRALAAIGRALPGSVRLVLLRAEGVSFSAGLDRAAFTPEGIPGERSLIDLAKGDEGDAVIAGYQEAFTWWRRPDLLSIAAVQGHAVGAGFQLALACDLRVCADDVQFAMRETSLGLVPDLAGTKPLVDLVGPSASAWRTSPSRPPTSTPPRPTSAPPCSPPPVTRWWRPRRCSRGRPPAATSSSRPPSAPPSCAGSRTWPGCWSSSDGRSVGRRVVGLPGVTRSACSPRGPAPPLLGWR